MATATLSPDQDTVVVEIFIAAPPARVYEAITDPKQVASWWGAKGVYRITENHSELRPGGKWWSVGVGADGTSFRVEGEYLEIDPPRLLSHTWMGSFSGSLKSTVRWELEPEEVHGLHPSGPHRLGTGTRVTIRHSGFLGNLEIAKNHGQGWIRVLGWMQAFVERGETAETRN